MPPPVPLAPPRPAGLILAGGRSSRMGGGDKALLPLGGRPMIAHVIERLGCARAISANGDPTRFAGFGLPVLPDREAGFPGPLAGILAGLDWAAAEGLPGIVTAAADTPFFPPGLAAALAGAGGPVTLAVAGGRVQPTFGWWATAVRPGLARALAEGERRVAAVADSLGAGRLEAGPEDAFFNVNTPGDLQEAARRLTR